MRKIEARLKHLLTSNFINNKFNRIDVLVIKHSIEQYLKDVKYDFDMYLKMQRHRGYSEAMYGSCISELLIERIKKLIKSFEENGFDDNFDKLIKGRIEQNESIDKTWLEPNAYKNGQPFMFTTEFRLVNGAHRLAYVYLKNITPVLVFSEISPVEAARITPYDIEWFEERFSTNDLEIINNEVDELKKYLKND
jgi:hypothetical protein